MENSEEVHRSREHQWDDQWPAVPNESSEHLPDESDITDDDTSFPNVAGTIDVEEAIRDAEPYVPPLDPPVLPGGPEGIHVATGFGLSPDEEAMRDRAPRGDQDVQEQALLALQQDSLANQYDLHVHVAAGVARLTGTVPSIDDGEHAASVLAELPGVEDVLDDTTLDPTMGV